MTTENDAFKNAKQDAQKGIQPGPQGDRSAIEYKAAVAGAAAAARGS